MFSLKFLVNSLLSVIVATILIGCGSSSSSDNPASNNTKQGVHGVLYTQQGPVAGASVVVKESNGQLLGTATTDASGAYYVPTTVSAPYIAQAKDPKSGAVWYSISQNNNMNITHIGDFMIKRWYEALSLNTDQAFASLNVDTPVPEEAAMSAVVDQIFYPVAMAFKVESLNLFRDDLTVNFTRALRATVISGNTVSINMTDPPVKASINLQAVKNAQGDVIFSGQSTFGTAMRAPSEQIATILTQLLQSFSPISNAYAAEVNSNLGGIVPNVKSTGANEHWMSDNWSFIKDKKLADIVIPGTHDSGTYKLGWGSGINTAKTQNVSIGEQLKDGIRYLDMRVTEAAHTGCADNSVWWLFHTWKSYRLQEALDEVKAFMSKPANNKEVVILDFQDITMKYDDGRAIDVLLALIQSKLGPYLVPMDQTTNWQHSTLSDFVAQGRQIIVLVPTSTSTRVNAPGFNPGCGAKFDGKYFAPRGGNLRSYYAELTDSQEIQEQVITPQLQKDSAVGNDRFNAYRTQQSKGLLNVIQIVPRPSNLWYTAAAVNLAWGYPNDLLTYASLRINAPLNLKISKSDVFNILQTTNSYGFNVLDASFYTVPYPLAPYCTSGWLGKRLKMGIQGSREDWNTPNIIIVDNYNPTVPAAQYDWILPKYANGNWTKDWQGGYVDFIIRLNKLPRDDSLSGVSNFADGQCLQ